MRAGFYWKKPALRLLLSCPYVLYGFLFDAQMFVDSDPSVACRRLGQKPYLDCRVGRKMEISHHIEMLSIHRIVKSEVVAYPADMEPCRISFQIAAVGVVGISLCHYAYRGVRSEVCEFIAAFCLAVHVFHDHDGRGIIGVLKFVRYLDF